MNRNDKDLLITPSVLDRLIDNTPEVSRELVVSRSKGMQMLKESLRRDLEWLLNTRQKVQGIPEEMTELCNSVAAYGLPDFSTMSVRSKFDRQRIRRALESAIAAFEPRLKDATVTIEPAREGEQALRFRINAHLMVEPAPVHVAFDTTLQLHNCLYLVKAA